jgi:hypothetical protein
MFVFLVMFVFNYFYATQMTNIWRKKKMSELVHLRFICIGFCVTRFSFSFFSSLVRVRPLKCFENYLWLLPIFGVFHFNPKPRLRIGTDPSLSLSINSRLSKVNYIVNGTMKQLQIQIINRWGSAHENNGPKSKFHVLSWWARLKSGHGIDQLIYYNNCILFWFRIFELRPFPCYYITFFHVYWDFALGITFDTFGWFT